jgi:hypothetical protein
LVVVMTATPLAAASAQEYRVGASKNWTTHGLLRDPAGLSLGVGFPIRDRLGIRIGYEWSGQDFQSFGSTCVGLANPEADCAGETRDDQARMNTLMVSVPVLVYEWQRIVVDLIPRAQLSKTSSVQTGTRTGRSRSADKSMAGVGLGAEVRIPVSARWPIHANLTGSVAWLEPLRNELIVDGYTPFDTGVRVSKLEAGLAVILR